MHTATRLRALVLRQFRGSGRQVAFLATGLLIQFGVLLVIALPWIFFVPESAGAVLIALVVPLTAVVLAGPLLTEAQHARFRTRLGVDIPSPYEGRPPRLRAWLRSPVGRRQLLYHLLDGPLVSLAAILVLLTWAAAAAAALAYVWIWLVSLDYRADHPEYSTWAAYLTAAGIALLYLAAWLSGALTRLDTRIAAVLLGPSRAEQLERRVEVLTESRAGLVDVVDAERRRIERDLHDGAQQRLVSLAVNLGIAKATLGDLPEDARRVIDEAHREAKEAIEELSSLVRGLHPAVLEDRGLDAALSGLAARTPIPVRVSVHLTGRLSPTVESVAYFVVSEALTNVVKHAEASEAEVTVERAGTILLVVIRDDGVGGARPGAGSGLSGLAKRVASVDGTLSVDSPAGGPTVITVELPCVP
ncbi:sensor histidine kinase [Streptomyces coacervatus]|uniref:histidine kinase n=1 Tax=Streptomyces coacervatus TaxID=647381 RepID=A0ABP7HUK4_9ACTN|nr:sensor histidine kinase [Streptomyces coacervatus]MDF2271002.1 histidine kinase [Streptomyces coacervatus]